MDTCSTNCPCMCGCGLMSAGIWFPVISGWYDGFGSSGGHWL